MTQVAQLPVAQGQSERRSIIEKVASRYDMDKAAFIAVVRDQVSPKGRDAQPLTDPQLAALMVVANEYDLNPLTREIYAFPAKGGGVIPILSIDGWAGMVARHPKADGYDFTYEHDEKGNPVSCTCTMHRKDRGHPIVVTEYMAECKRSTEPWNQFPRRMLRHKALIQCARYAFGFAGVYDEDEARDIERNTAREYAPRPPSIPSIPSVPDIIDAEPSQEPQEAVSAPDAPEQGQDAKTSPDPKQGRSKQPYVEMGQPEPLIEPDKYDETVKDYLDRMKAAPDAEVLNEVWDEAQVVWNELMPPDQAELNNAYNERMGAFEG